MMQMNPTLDSGVASPAPSRPPARRQRIWPFVESGPRSHIEGHPDFVSNPAPTRREAKAEPVVLRANPTAGSNAGGRRSTHTRCQPSQVAGFSAAGPWLLERGPSAAQYAADQVDSVQDDPTGRFALLRSLYEDLSGFPRRHLPYRRAALAFMDWQLQRGVLNRLDSPEAGSPWWRAVNVGLIRDTAEARARVLGCTGLPSSEPVRFWLTFIEHPSARAWYRAHNASIVSASIDNRRLARTESAVEVFFLNLILVRVLYAHALVAAPRLALGHLGRVAPLLGDPRLGSTGLFLSLARVLPDRYPLDGDLQRYVDAELGFGRLLDLGVIQPRLDALYAWSAAELAIPRLRGLIRDGVPAYATDANDPSPWNNTPKTAVRLARRVLPPPSKRDVQRILSAPCTRPADAPSGDLVRGKAIDRPACGPTRKATELPRRLG